MKERNRQAPKHLTVFFAEPAGDQIYMNTKPITRRAMHIGKA